MKKLFYFLLAFSLAITANTAFAASPNTDPSLISYTIGDDYYIDINFEEGVDPSEYLRFSFVDLTGTDSFVYNEDVFIMPDSGTISTSILLNFFERLGGEGTYDVEISICEAEVGSIPYYEETDPYCEPFANETITYVRTSLDQIVLPSAPIVGYEDGVMSNYDDYYVVFPDVDAEELEGIAALELYRRNVIGGYSDGEFKGDQNVNRAEAAKFLMLARYGLDDSTVSSDPFPDVGMNEWFAPYVKRCADEGIINGYPDGLFRPADTVNTAEFLKMLTLTFGLETGLPYTYTDVSSSDWFSVYAGIAEEYNLFPNKTSELNPDQDLTRNEVAVAIYQYFYGRDVDMTDAAIVVRDLFSGLDADICNNTDVSNLLSNCGTYADEVVALRAAFLDEFLGDYSVADFEAGLVPMTLYVQENTGPVSSDTAYEAINVEIENSDTRDVVLYLAIGDRRADFDALNDGVPNTPNNNDGLDHGLELEEIPFDVLRVEAISYSYDNGYYYGPGILNYQWTGAGYQGDHYYAMQLDDYAQSDPYADYTILFHVLGSEYNKTRDNVVNPMGVLHYYVNTIHNFLDENSLEDGDSLYYVDGFAE
ncbi:MAG: S-layer homology domain-containing protein [Candidatus Gracilibacteria bacterium]